LFGPEFATKSIVEEEPKNSNPDAASKSNDNSPFSTAATELTKQHILRFPTGCKSLDKLLDGGIEAGVITQVYGGPGVGKTQFCYTLCVMLPPEYDAIYLDTESSFRPQRIEDIAKARGLDSKQILQRIHITNALDCNGQESRIEAACSACEKNLSKIKLLIVDSIIIHYNAEFAGRSKLSEKNP
jgi:DNA repair protein RadA